MPRIGYPDLFFNTYRWPIRCMQDLQRSLQDQSEVCQLQVCVLQVSGQTLLMFQNPWKPMVFMACVLWTCTGHHGHPMIICMRTAVYRIYYNVRN